MTFLTSMLGVHFEGDARRPGERCIGEVVCRECENVMARLHAEPSGVTFHGWLPGRNPSAPDAKSGGYELFAVIGDEEPEGQEGTTLLCWRGHGPWWIDAADCRAMVARHRERGKKVRHAAREATDELLQSES